jgi:hypothetical protein
MQEKKSKEMRVFQNRDILRSSHGTKYHSWLWWRHEKGQEGCVEVCGVVRP